MNKNTIKAVRGLWTKLHFLNQKEIAPAFYDIKNESFYFICDENQSMYVRFLLNSNNIIFSDLINSLELEICDNSEEHILKKTIRVMGSAPNILKFIHAMRTKFKISAFQEYIDVSKISTN